VSTEVEVLLDVTPSRLVCVWQRFGVPCCLHLLDVANQVECISIILNCHYSTETSVTSLFDVT